MRGLFLLGRAIFGGFFVYNGLNHFIRRSGMSQGTLLLAAGLSVVTGIKPRQGLAGIVAFLAPVSWQMHRFWEEDEPARTADQVQFFMNLALIGAALALMQIEEPWPLSLDQARDHEEEMFIRLGGRDLRALPA